MLRLCAAVFKRILHNISSLESSWDVLHKWRKKGCENYAGFCINCNWNIPRHSKGTFMMTKSTLDVRSLLSITLSTSHWQINPDVVSEGKVFNVKRPLRLILTSNYRSEVSTSRFRLEIQYQFSRCWTINENNSNFHPQQWELNWKRHGNMRDVV